MTKFIAALVAIFLSVNLVGGVTSVAAQSLESIMPSSAGVGTLHAFSRSERRHQLSEVAAAFDGNDRIFRAPKALELFRYAITTQLGGMSDGQIAALLRSAQVRTVACVGSIRTTGYDNIGRVAWFTRSCAPGEELLQVQVGAGWVTVASLWCLNPISDQPVRAAAPNGAPCSEMHVLPEVARSGRTWLYTTDPAMIRRCNPDIRLCPDCQDFVDGRRPFRPEGTFAAYVQQVHQSGGRVQGLVTQQRPQVIWTDPGSTLFYCLEQWGRGSRVDLAPVRR